MSAPCRFAKAFAVVALICSACSGSDAGRGVLVGGAASTQEVLDAAIEDWNRENGDAVHATYASSARIARQIEAGAPIDVFVSANRQWAEAMVSSNRVIRQRVVARNELALVARAGAYPGARVDSGTVLPAALMGVRWSTGDPEHVPVGEYARAALESLGWWPALEGNLVPASDVRAGLRLLELGEVEFAVCYATDVQDSARVRAGVWTVHPIDRSLHPPAHVVAVLLSENPAAADFFDWFTSPAAASAFAERGFSEAMTEVSGAVERSH